VLAKSGKYGKLWKSLLDSDPELLVDAGYQLFQCPGCHKIISEYCMDLYKSVRDTFGFYTPSPEEVLYEYKHICPDCQKKMTKITLVPEYSQYADPNPEELVICPQCGDVAIASFCGHFD
jgi:predicted RNA-binding Zn-ribbon protein involved in translation (DUF1610 family)